MASTQYPRKRRRWSVVEGVRAFPCPRCGGKGGWYEYLGDQNVKTSDCCDCAGDGFIETGSPLHRHLFISGVEMEIINRSCRSGDDYYATEPFSTRWESAMKRVSIGLGELFDLYVERYGKPPDSAGAGVPGYQVER